MDNLTRFVRQGRSYLFWLLLIENLLVVAVFWASATFTTLPAAVDAGGAFVLSIVLAVGVLYAASNYWTPPLTALWQAILHLSPDNNIAAPQVEQLHAGRELVAGLTAQLYQLTNVASQAANAVRAAQTDLSQNFVASNLPLPLIVIDPSATILFANGAAAEYIGIQASDLRGKNIYMVLDMSFPNEDTFDRWLKEVKLKNATAVGAWERVRLNVRDNHPVRMFDLAAYYNRDNPNRIETMLVLFDHTKQYSQDDQAVSFTALSVHELRTPLTLLRGYIEVFQEELGDKVDPELQGFILKMRAMAEQLTTFVNNVLNVARIDDNQLELQLQQEDWATVLKSAVDLIALRARVRGITLHVTVANGLPPVGVDRLSIREVVNNLIDNAIKYSGDSKTIEIDAHLTADGYVETTVRDFGLGISDNIMANLFTKFYRDHRNRAQIGGTGLGLYLSKAIVTAHGGTIWVRSKPGEGSTFGFTVLPYTRIADQVKQDGSQAEITREANGWIKNHSLYRR